MAAPTVLAESWTTPSGSNATTYVITVPTGSAGDVVECLVGSTSNAALSVSSGSGWKLVQQWKHASGLSEALFRKKLGTSGADSLTVASATSCRFNAHTVRLPVGTRTYASYAGATATSTNSNPPLVDHKKSRDTLYTAYRAGAGTVVPSAGPSGYGTRVNNAATSGGVSLTYAYKTATSSSDDPGTFTVSSALWGCVTIARWIDTTGPLLTAWRALCASPPSTPLRLAGYGTSFTAGRYNAGGGTDSQAGDSFATSRPAEWAASFTALPAKAFLLGTAGLVTPTATDMYNLDNRFSADSSFTPTDSFAFYLQGRAGWGLTTAGHKGTYALGAAFDRVKVRFWSDPTLSVYTIDVDGGTPQNISNLTMAAGYREQTFNLTGTSSSVIHINSPGGASTIEGIEVWTDGSPQVSVFNVGWSSGNSNDFVTHIAGVAALAPHLAVLETYLNDGPAGITPEQGMENSRQMVLAVLAAGGEAMLTAFTYAGAPGAEAGEDAYHATFEDMADTLGAAWYSVHGETGFTSKTAQNAAGYTDELNPHPYPAGYVAWGNFERAFFDPPQILSPGLLTNSQTFYAPTITTGAVSLTPGLFSNTNAFYAPTVSQSGGGQSLTPGLLSNTNAFYGPMITAGVVTVSPGLLTNSNTFYNPTVSMGAVTLTPGLLTNTNSFFAPTITTGSVTLSPGLLTNANTFYAPAVTQPGGAVLWTPADYTGGELESWHDPSEPGGLTVSGGAVSQDDDLSGNGYHDTQGFGPLQPAIAAADLNGLDVEDFAGGKSFGSTLPSDATTQTLLILGKWSGSGPATLFGSTSGSLQFGVNSSGNLFLNRQGVAGIGNSTGALVVSGAWAIMVATYDKATGAYSFRVNGTPCGSGTNIQTLDPSTFIIGNNVHFGGEAWSDKISERSALNTADVGAIEKWEGYVAWKYGLEGDLDAGHTYKSAAPTVGPGSQTLTPGLLTNTNTFFNPTVTPGSVTLTPGLLTNSNTFYAPTVTPGAATLSAGLLTNASVFYGPTVNQPSLQTLTPGLLTNVSVFYPPAANQNDPPGTYPLSIDGGGLVVREALAGGGSVVAGSLSASGRVVLGSIRGRP